MVIEKKTLRAGIRKKLQAPLPEVSAAIRSRLKTLGCWHSCRTILAYHPLEEEVDLLPLLPYEATKDWIFPRVHGESLSLHRWTRGATWRKGLFGILEPDPEHWPAVGVGEIDLALIPGLAFDGRGNRLGRGKGYYDRFLSSAAFRGLRIGIVSECFLLPEIPTEPHDVAMDLVVTESGVHPSS